MAEKMEFMRSVTACDGTKFNVDGSDEACRKFGFLANEEIMTPHGHCAIIMGAAPAPEGSKAVGQDVLWYLKDDGKTYYFGPGNLRELGFKLKSEMPPAARKQGLPAQEGTWR